MTRSTTTPETPQPSRYLLMTEGREHGYYHLFGRVVTQRYEQGAYVPEGPDDEYTGGPLYSGLQLRCQGDEDSRRRALSGERDAPVYGYDCEYRDVYHVDRRRAVRMAKTLTSLDAKLEKLHEKRGAWHTYGDYVGRIAEALGCVGIGFTRTAKSREITGQRWQWETIGYGVSRIDRQIAAWVDEARPQPAPEPEAARCQAQLEGGATVYTCQAEAGHIGEHRHGARTWGDPPAAAPEASTDDAGQAVRS